MNNRITYLIAGLLVAAGVLFLVFTATETDSQFFVTVGELNQLDNSERGRRITVSGAVVGDSIVYQPENPSLEFLIADIPSDLEKISDLGGLSKVLDDAVNDPNRERLLVVYKGVKPDLLKDGTQAIIRGALGDDGNFYADDLIMKCPTRYAEDLPEQIED